jgi:hypothetical protein
VRSGRDERRGQYAPREEGKAQALSELRVSRAPAQERLRRKVAAGGMTNMQSGTYLEYFCPTCFWFPQMLITDENEKEVKKQMKTMVIKHQKKHPIKGFKFPDWA